MPRKIIHIDADSFYASVEMRDNPELRHLPLAVGGKATARGVIATCNYEARKYGVHSAMASSRALQLCPQLVIVKPRFPVYREISQQFHSIFRQYTDLIEPLSLDEAFLDVSDCTIHSGSATLIAQAIREQIQDQLQLTVSAGVAPNKFLAKVGSDWDKPDGCYTIAPHQIPHFVRELPVSRINGVGAVTAAKLENMGVSTCGDLQQIPLDTLIRRFGKYGSRLSELAFGNDDRPVRTSRIRKSISVENTYNTDLHGELALNQGLDAILTELAERFGKIDQHYTPHKRFVKIKFDNFKQTTLEQTLLGNVQDWYDVKAYRQLLHQAWGRGQRPVRLLGAGLRLEPQIVESSLQLGLFSEDED